MRLIDAVAYRRELEREKKCERTGDVLMGLEIAIADLGDMPTIDAEPVKHSQWKYYRKQGKAVCMTCSFERNLDDNFGRAVACPNCGARMDGDSNG
jgi:hypothetical protein